jgi:hypothetical protein
VLKTHCPSGHPYSGNNLFVSSNGWRKCRQCNRDYAKKRWRILNPIPKPKGPPKVLTVSARRMVWAPNHPLKTKNGYVAESRKVLYDTIGHGPHNCKWCHREIHWVVLNG